MTINKIDIVCASLLILIVLCWTWHAGYEYGYGKGYTSGFTKMCSDVEDADIPDIIISGCRIFKPDYSGVSSKVSCPQGNQLCDPIALKNSTAAVSAITDTNDDPLKPDSLEVVCMYDSKSCQVTPQGKKDGWTINNNQYPVQHTDCLVDSSTCDCVIIPDNIIPDSNLTPIPRPNINLKTQAEELIDSLNQHGDTENGRRFTYDDIQYYSDGSFGII